MKSLFEKNSRKKLSFSVITKSINKIYLPLLKNSSRYLHIYGGAGSGKSYFAAQKILLRVLTEPKHRFLLVRKVARTIRNSQYSLIKHLVYIANLQKYFNFRESDLSIECTLHGNKIISAGLDDREKLKSIFGITSIWIEEATELEFEDFNQINLRVRGKTANYKQIILTYNPVNVNHWLNTRTFQNCTKIKTTFKDNTFIDEEYITILNELKNQDENYYKIYALGEWGSLKNLIFKPFELIENYPSEFDEIIYGLDFGYNNPTALIEVGIKDKEFFLKELIYETRLTNTELIARIKQLGIKKSAPIYCDSSESNRIQELCESGFNVLRADKNVRDGIDFLKASRIYSNSNNININKEVLAYSYKEDRNGQLFDEPVKFNDHSMDAIRYAIFTHCKKREEPRIRIIG
ncbi:MAG: PBSX family phage terminase large subunit [Ignavibacteria bacterium]